MNFPPFGATACVFLQSVQAMELKAGGIDALQSEPQGHSVPFIAIKPVDSLIDCALYARGAG